MSETMKAVMNREANAGATRENEVYDVPTVDIRETPEGFCLEADMPGVNKSGLEIMLEGNELTIVGRRAPTPQQGERLHWESTGRAYRRTFVLDPSIDAQGIEARIDQGTLTLALPKAEEVKPRRIRVTD